MVLKNSILQDLYKVHPGIKQTILSFENESNIYLKGLLGSAKSLICCCIFKKIRNRNLLCVLNDLEEAGYFYHDCCQVLGEKDVLFFPSQFRRNIRYGQKNAANEILRIEVLSRLNNGGQPCIIVSYPDALAEKVVDPNKLKSNTLTINIHEKIDVLFVMDVLNSYHFEQVDYVYEPGQYAVRGSIVDVFSFSNEYPYRIDFFGDEIESIRSFNIETQLSKDKLNSISIISANSGNSNTTLFSYLPITTGLILKKEDWIYERFHSLWNEMPILTNEETFSSVEQMKKFLIPEKTIRSLITSYKKIHLETSSHRKKDTIIEFSTELQVFYHKNFDLVSSYLKEKLQESYTLYILSSSEKQIKRIKSIFEDRGDVIPFIPVLNTLHAGFIDKTLRICLFTDHQLFDRFHKYNLKSEKVHLGKIALSLKELQQFQVGDYLVHIDHGIGKFGGLIRTETNGKMQEVVKMTFLNEDTIFTSIHNLHKIFKYKGKDNEPPRLNRLGSRVWENLKEKTKKKVKDIAKDLIQLYSKRREEKGFAFSSDTYLQKELEASFFYENTPDQAKVNMEIKKDMENIRPMDRLVCGDVGFGKTELAIRAAFKAVTDSKQVAVLVPTTLLAFQHYNTFKERLSNFPVTINYISRARTTKDSKTIIKKLKEGTIDILIGTHRIVSKDVQFKDLGLLIIDEEQKFGVEVKEKLKQMKTNIDSLTLTATPIPRTLQFSLMGARDISNISTPPPNRYPIHTELHRFEKNIIREAINFEMSRNGQIFIINNRISNLGDLKDLVKKEIPDGRIAIGHGQMESTKLEQIITDFVNYEYDILISTSIIENGIDIPNANTIIINNAQNFGLSDLHQLRGRVGRGNRKAFCYLLCPPLSNLTPKTVRRLHAIEGFSELGSGIHIAMQDLDIRGAGDILGAEQSGFIADLGYETYQKILSEAIQELKNEKFSNLYKDENQIDTGENYVMETNLESDLEIYFPTSYVPNDSERILLYRELDTIEEEHMEQFRIKLQDRFGKIPAKVEELILIVRLRRMAKKSGIEKIVLKDGKMILYLVKNFDSPYYQSKSFDQILEFAKTNYKYCNILEKNNRRMLSIQNISTVEKAVKILEEIKK
ncbi:transcription-repair coupling factor [Candidatus Azobacteroides pseudotrichonymphae]|uniref:Transcription-repair-coupling factor n=1 Tax=Azobacteroides pseudotrichonymphae genomovar. CFP2 TaxID=511995 RepID=B6YQL6_AZOPC|nr:transcription-repair coupling factor [Candidatus Azobacteroides pseudotrichonymphae genomovar. CFP2]